MDYRLPFIIFSGILAASSSIPYLIDVVKYRTRPRIASWIIWAIMKIIACVAALLDQQYITAILLAVSLMGTTSVIVFGWEFGNREFRQLDIGCLIGAVIGVIFWLLLDSPEIAVLVSIAIGLIGWMPTIYHSWNRPIEETWTYFLLSFLAAVSILLTVVDWKITAFAFPLYLAVINVTVTIIIVLRRLSLSVKNNR